MCLYILGLIPQSYGQLYIHSVDLLTLWRSPYTRRFLAIFVHFSLMHSLILTPLHVESVQLSWYPTDPSFHALSSRHSVKSSVCFCSLPKLQMVPGKFALSSWEKLDPFHVTQTMRKSLICLRTISNWKSMICWLIKLPSAFGSSFLSLWFLLPLATKFIKVKNRGGISWPIQPRT